MRIGDLARRLRVSARTLRHYEAVGLLGVPAHESRNGYRSYGAAELLRGVQIEQLKAAGLSLDEIRRVLDEGATAEEVLATRRRELAAVVRRGQRRLTVLDALARPYADVARPSLTTSDRAQVVSERVTPAAGDLGPAVRTGIQRLRRQLKRVDPGGSWTFAARFPVDLDVEPLTAEVAAIVRRPTAASTTWPARSVIEATVTGPLALLPLAYDALFALAEEHELVPAGSVTETYVDLGVGGRTPTTVVALGVEDPHPARR
jgi:DNA-binding transcriptional MerR regulator